MKKLLLSASVLLLATGAFAQTKMTGTDARFGIKAGVNLSKYQFSGNSEIKEEIDAFNDYQKSNIGFNVTAYGDFGIANNLTLRPAISLQNKGTKYENNDEGVSASFTQNTMWIDIPVNLVYSIPTGDVGAFEISAGPYIGFGISGKNKFSGTDDFLDVEDENFKFGNDALPVIGSAGIDYGANFGLGYRLSSGFTVGANYGLGLGNLIPKDARADADGAKQKNRVIGFSVGYSF